jgi:hypothetical protein
VERPDREIITLLQHQTNYLHRDQKIQQGLINLLSQIETESPEAHLIAAEIAFNPVSMNDAKMVGEFLMKSTGHFKDDFRFHSSNQDKEEFGLRSLVNAYSAAKKRNQLDRYSLNIMTAFQKFLENKKSSVEERIEKRAKYTAAGCATGTTGALCFIYPGILCLTGFLSAIGYDEPAPAGSNAPASRRSFLIDATSDLFTNKVNAYKENTSRSTLIEICEHIDAVTKGDFFKDNLAILEPFSTHERAVAGLLSKLYTDGIIVRSDAARIEELKALKDK